MVSYRWRSDPQMLVLVTLMIGSFGSLITGSATSSTEMSRKPRQVTAFHPRATPCASRHWSDASRLEAPSAACRHRPPRTLPSRNRPAGLRERRSPPRPLGRYRPAEWDTEPFHQMGILVLLTSHGGAISPGAPAFAVIWYWPNSSAKVLTNPPMPCLAAS
jgi:hypothetical protein